MTTRWGRVAQWLVVLLIAGTALVALAPAANALSTEPSFRPEIDFDEVPDIELIRREVCPDGRIGTNTDTVVPDDCWNGIPSSHYDIGCDEGAWNHLSRKGYCFFTDFAFQGGRASTSIALWLIGWAFGFGVYDTLGATAIGIADLYTTRIIGPLGLNHIVWFYAISWAAFTALRGRLMMAGGELLVSFVAALLAAFLLANPAGYLEGTFRLMGAASTVILTNGEVDDLDSGLDSTHMHVEPLQAQLHETFVEIPYDYINWGTADMPEQCRYARELILLHGPHGSNGDPRRLMQSIDGCRPLRDFNHDPSGARLFGAFLVLTAAAIMMVLIGLVSLTVIVAQILAVVLFAFAPFAALMAVVPGSGRELAFRWFAALARTVFVVIGMSMVLSLLLLSVQALLDGTTGLGLIERFTLVNVAIVGVFIVRKRIVASGAQLANQLGQGFRAGGAGGGRGGGGAWGSSPAVAGATGFAIGSQLGNDRPGTIQRTAQSRLREHRANARMGKLHKAGDKRAKQAASQVAARERSEVVPDGQGGHTTRRSVSIDGPVARTRRAQRTRARVEASAARRTTPRPTPGPIPAPKTAPRRLPTRPVTPPPSDRAPSPPTGPIVR